MDITQACKILEIEPGASAADVDKAFRKLAVKHHPDKHANNQEAAEIQFKKINEAYQLLKEQGTSPKVNFGSNSNFVYDIFNAEDLFRVHFGNVNNDFFASPWSSQRSSIQHIVDISFEESVSGCKKQINLKRQIRCDKCKATGVVEVISSEPCSKCDGTKKVDVNGKELPCTRCGATGFAKSSARCGECSGTRRIHDESLVQVSIPGGVISGSVLKLKSQGDYNPAFNIYGDASIKISVQKDSELSRSGDDVTSCVTISLLDALKGASREVRTAYGLKTLKIKPCIKNNDVIRVKGFGVNNSNYHIFTIKVEYPDDINSLIEFLENKQVEEIEGEE